MKLPSSPVKVIWLLLAENLLNKGLLLELLTLHLNQHLGKDQFHLLLFKSCSQATGVEPMTPEGRNGHLERPDLILWETALDLDQPILLTNFDKNTFQASESIRNWVLETPTFILHSNLEPLFNPIPFPLCLDVYPTPLDLKPLVQAILKFISHKDTPFNDLSNLLHNVPLMAPKSSEYPTTSLFREISTASSSLSFSNAPKILLVDDQEFNIQLLKMTLAPLNLNISIATEGYQAVEMAKNIQPDLILLDIMMPGLDGYQVLEALKGMPETEKTIKILVSALDQPQNLLKGFELGIFDYIKKPFHIEEVKARVMAALQLKTAQDKLTYEHGILAQIFRFSADALALMDESFNIKAMNHRFAEWFNLPNHSKSTHPLLFPSDVGFSQLNSLNFPTLLNCQCHHPGYCLLHKKEEYQSHIDHSGLMTFAVEQNHLSSEKTNLQRYLQGRFGRVYEKPGQPKEYVLVLRDITLETEINQRKDTFVATLSHDLKTPIQSELRALSLLQSEALGPLTPEQREVTQEIVQSSKFMKRMVENLLSSYQYEDGHIHLQYQWFSINDILQTLLQGEVKELLSEKRIELSLSVSANVPPYWGDPVEMARVFQNIILNAIKFTPPLGFLTIQTLLVSEGIQIAIQDSGKGIPPEDLHRIFDRYFSMARKFKEVGTGLGLYLSKQIVQAHEGKIWVESTPGHGSCFVVVLPTQIQQNKTNCLASPTMNNASNHIKTH
ncbi:MAG: response regulator [Cyanobacteria bacterium]|nr:response regulator [Cyanobacteriota bacterium]